MTEVPTKAATSTEPGERTLELLDRMTLEEKLAQIVGFWEKEDGEAVAPLQGEFGTISNLEQATRHGLGHLTRAYGTRPVDAAERARWVWGVQRGLVTGTRLGIPAIVHEECLTGFTTYQATVYPAALAWAATFDPVLVKEMASAIGRDMAAVGVQMAGSPVTTAQSAATLSAK